MRSLTPLTLVAALAVAACPDESHAVNHKHKSGFVHSDSIRWPAGTEVQHFENLEGIVLMTGRLRGVGSKDTSGPLALDTGAGYLALDLGLARALGIADSVAHEGVEEVFVAERPLPRLTLGDWTMDQVQPVLTVDAEVVRRVSDRPVLGLIGQKPLRDRAVWIDYREQVVAFIPLGPPAGTDSALTRSRALLSGVLSSRAVPVPFALVGDGKILVHGTVSDPRPPRASGRLNLLIDTGATKSVLFEDALQGVVAHAEAWPALRGLSAPTLIGPAQARIARIPVCELEAAPGVVRVKDIDVGVIRSELGEILSRATEETIHGLIGYSFLKRFRVTVDYPDRVLWLDPVPDYRDDRPLEYCHVGIQLERQDGVVIVVAVGTDSPAARAGIAPGDELVAVDGAPARPLDLITIARRMEGRPGTSLTLVVRRSDVAHTHRLVRRRLL